MSKRRYFSFFKHECSPLAKRSTRRLFFHPFFQRLEQCIQPCNRSCHIGQIELSQCPSAQQEREKSDFVSQRFLSQGRQFKEDNQNHKHRNAYCDVPSHFCLTSSSGMPPGTVTKPGRRINASIHEFDQLGTAHVQIGAKSRETGSAASESPNR